MRIVEEMSLTNFRFWSGGKYNADMLTYDELERLEDVLESMYEEIDAVMLNDLFWFDFDTVCDLLGYVYDANEDVIIRSE